MNVQRRLTIVMLMIAIISVIAAIMGSIIMSNGLTTSNLTSDKNLYLLSMSIKTEPVLIITTFITSVSSIAVIVLNLHFFRSSSPIAHNIAIVGFPQSGKTTLIITLFGEIFAQRIKNIDATLKTATTIERVNENLNRLQKGLSIGPTKDQDTFAYRTNIKIKSGLFSQTYKVEFGDFPGEDSTQYSFEFGPWLHTTPFFQWMASADVVVFVIDIGRYLLPTRGEYIADMSGAIRASWQHIVNNADEGAIAAKNRQVTLVFTKSDLFGLDMPMPVDELEKQLLMVGFGKTIPPVNEIDINALRNGEENVRRDFNDLIKYLESETKFFNIVFTSSFSTLNGQRMGVNELLQSILPQHTTILW